MPSPTWLTGWVKMNSKHVVHASGKSEEDKCHQTATTGRSPCTEQASSSASSARKPKSSSKGRSWSRKTKGKSISGDCDESKEESNVITQNLTHQILSEAAFMAQPQKIPSDPMLQSYRTQDIISNTASISALPTGRHHRNTPEGLIVTTTTLKARPKLELKEPQNQNHHLNRLASIFAGERQPCQSCISLEKKIDAVHDDLEYMRSVALQQQKNTRAHHHSNDTDCACATCLPTVTTKPSATSATELQELVKRNKHVVDSLMSERARYQANMELELEQHEIVGQDLNKQVAVKIQETITLQQQLETTRWERDELAIENLRLQAKVSSHAKQQAEYSELKRRYLDYEQRGIQGAVAEIESRDQVIDDLATKLERVLEQLELEREQQRQRRQIIFPPSPNAVAKKVAT